MFALAIIQSGLGVLTTFVSLFACENLISGTLYCNNSLRYWYVSKKVTKIESSNENHGAS